jgi:hypothetical protein
MIDENGARLLRKQYRGEIERAINNAKRTAWDKWFRRQWYRAGAMRGRRKAGRGGGVSQAGELLEALKRSRATSAARPGP